MPVSSFANGAMPLALMQRRTNSRRTNTQRTCNRFNVCSINEKKILRQIDSGYARHDTHGMKTYIRTNEARTKSKNAETKYLASDCQHDVGIARVTSTSPGFDRSDAGKTSPIPGLSWFDAGARTRCAKTPEPWFQFERHRAHDEHKHEHNMR